MAKRRKTRPGKKVVSDKRAPPAIFYLIAAMALLIGAAGGFIVWENAGSAEHTAESSNIGAGAGQPVASLAAAPRVGALAPDFTLTSTTGEQVALSDFRGQPMVVTFFHTW